MNDRPETDTRTALKTSVKSLLKRKNISMIHVIATIEIAPGLRDEFLREFHSIVDEVRSEKGCLAYEPTIDEETNLPNQPPLRENVVTVVEKWNTLEDLEAHLIAPHMIAYRRRVSELVRGTSLQVLRSA